MKVNQEQFQQWHDQYQPRLLASITAMVRDRDQAEDITAQALATAFQKIDQFEGKATFGTWLTRIAINQVHTDRRRQQAISFDALEEAHFECGEPDRVSDDLERLETDQKLRRALSQLPERNRQVLTDHFLRGYSIKEIAHQRGIPVGTVLSRISTGKRLLRRAWASAGTKAGR